MLTTRPVRRVSLSLLGLPAVALAVLASTATPAAAAEAEAADGCAGAASLSTVASEYVPPSPVISVVRSVRVGHHVGCDRIVFEFTGPVPQYRVGYVTRVIQDPTGNTLTLEGSAFLSMVIRTGRGEGGGVQPNLRPHFPVLRQLRGSGDFEGVTSYAAGLSSKQPFLAYRLTDPSRLVIDIHAPVGGQVSRVPTGGVETGGGSTAGSTAGPLTGDARPPMWPLAAGLLALATVTMVAITRRRTRSWAH